MLFLIKHQLYTKDTLNQGLRRYICYGYRETAFSEELLCEIISQLLVLPGIDVNGVSPTGYTCLHTIASCCHDIRENSFLLFLKRKELHVNALDPDGRTALMIACKKGHPHKVRDLLFSVKTDVHIKDKDGKTAYDLTTDERCKTLIRQRIQTQLELRAITEIELFHPTLRMFPLDIQRIIGRMLAEKCMSIPECRKVVKKINPRLPPPVVEGEDEEEEEEVDEDEEEVVEPVPAFF
jgi:hypothetical protein